MLAEGDYSNKIEDQNKINNRIEQFWNLIIKYIHIPPEYVYKYELDEEHPLYATLCNISYAFISNTSGLFLFVRVED